MLKAGKQFEDPPTGSHIARCYRVVDCGTRKNEWKGQVKLQRRIMISWEMPNVLMQTGEHAGEPFVISKFYTMSIGDKANLRTDLVNWRGKEFTPDELEGFDEKNLIGATCMISLTKNDKGKVNVTGIMRCPKGVEVPPAHNDTLYLSLEADRFDRAAFARLSDNMRATIEETPEWAELNGRKRDPEMGGGNASNTGTKHVDDFDDDIPF